MEKIKIIAFVAKKENGKLEHGGYQAHARGAVSQLEKKYNWEIEYEVIGIPEGAEIAPELYGGADIVFSLGYKNEIPNKVNTISLPKYSFGVPRKDFGNGKSAAFEVEAFNALDFNNVFDPDFLSLKGYDSKLVSLPYGAHARTVEELNSFIPKLSVEAKAFFENGETAVFHVSAPVGQTDEKFSAEEIKTNFIKTLDMIPAERIAIVPGGRLDRAGNLQEPEANIADIVKSVLATYQGKKVMYIDEGFAGFMATTALADVVVSTGDSTSNYAECSVKGVPNLVAPWDWKDLDRGVRVQSLVQAIKDGGVLKLGDTISADKDWKVLNSAEAIADAIFTSN